MSKRSVARRSVATFCVLAAIASAGSVRAQTNYSLRLRALSIRFAGIVEDAISDGFLNPAQVSAVPGTQLYVAKHPSTVYLFSHPRPIQSTFDSSLLPNEVQPSRSFSINRLLYTPYEITLFLQRASISVEIYTNSSDGIDEDEMLAGSPFGVSDLSGMEEISGGRDVDTHLRLAAAYSTATEPDGRGVGLRGIVLYRKLENSWIDTRYHLQASGSPAELRADYRFDAAGAEFKQLEASITGGFHHPKSALRDLIGGLSYVRQESSADDRGSLWLDEDLDGNGFDPGGGIPRQESRSTRLATDRTYEGPRIFGRLHSDFTDDVKFTMSASWEQLNGSGNADFINNVEDEFTAVTKRQLDVTYEYDGRESRYHVDAAVGFRRDVTPEVLFAGGLYGSWDRLNLAEDATGDGSLYIVDPPDSSTLDSPYAQRLLRLDDVFRAIFPAAVEWRPLEFLELRLGAELWVEHWEYEDVYRQMIDVDSPELPGTVEDRDRESGTRTRFLLNNGIAAHLDDRLFIDLTSSLHDSVDLGYYVNLSLRYRF